MTIIGYTTRLQIELLAELKQITLN
jgi:hypothetical protein